jgi:hypothetical protein
MNLSRLDLLDVVFDAALLTPRERRMLRVQIEMDLLRNVAREAQDPKNWKAAAWALERLYPQRYAPRRRQKSPKNVSLT